MGIDISLICFLKYITFQIFQIALRLRPIALYTIAMLQQQSITESKFSPNWLFLIYKHLLKHARDFASLIFQQQNTPSMKKQLDTSNEFFPKANSTSLLYFIQHCQHFLNQLQAQNKLAIVDSSEHFYFKNQIQSALTFPETNPMNCYRFFPQVSNTLSRYFRAASCSFNFKCILIITKMSTIHSENSFLLLVLSIIFTAFNQSFLLIRRHSQYLPQAQYQNSSLRRLFLRIILVQQVSPTVST